ncbi:MAG: SPFH domain-containing protein, partial [Clostridia bacterium]|nr:SPFH domain-containing protein [Clostridia bacterium]
AVLLLLILAELLSLGVMIVGIANEATFGGPLILLSILLMTLFSIMFAGLRTVRPNEALVLTLFGKYHGTINKAGFFYVNPFSVGFNPAYEEYKEDAARKARTSGQKGQESVTVTPVKKTISLKVQTLDNGCQKVNDLLGNPIIIGAVVIWRVADPTMAVFSVENYKTYLSIQTDSTIRNTARLYPYDVFDENEDGAATEKTLRSSALEIAETMQIDLQEKVKDAGLIIEDVRITQLSYSEEIAAAMLQRQQAVAIIAARQKIVDGAVGMVKMAVEKLNEDEVVLLDEERKAAMVSNLLVVLCGNKDAQPVVNSGSIY